MGSDRPDDAREPCFVPDLSIVEGGSVDLRDEGQGYRTSLLVIRAWVEEGSSRPLRAQIRLSSDVSRGFERTVNLTEIDVVCGEVRTWLQETLAGAEPE